MATDDELNVTNRPKFTKSTTPTGNMGAFVYVDMRGNLWGVNWDLGSQSWSVYPVKAVYGMPAGKLAFFGESASGIIDTIEDHAEKYRVANKSGGGGWLLLLLLYLATRKGGR